MSKGTVSGGTDGLYTATILKNDGTPEVKEAYCADLTEDLSGEVGVIEIAGDITNGVNIQPGYEGNAVYNATRDGEMYEVPRKPGTQPSAGVYHNWALFPGWQKWASKYRYATISALSGDTCTVTFDACIATDTPDGKQLDVNQVASMSATIEYMSCNGAAFEDGDEVIVELTHTQGVWSSAKVIGFKSEPKGCGFTFSLTHGDGTVITEASGLLSYIKIYNSSETLISTTTEWDVDAEIWRVTIDDQDDTDDNGYFAVYATTENGISTQYPYRYKTADKWNSADLITVGEYDDTIPYWKVNSLTYDPLPVYLYVRQCPLTEQFAFVINAPSPALWVQTLSTFDLVLTVNSSIPFKVTYSILPHYSTNWKETETGCISYQHTTYNVFSNDGALNFDYTTHPSPGVVVDSVWTNGRVSGVKKRMTVTVPEWTQMWIPGSSTVPFIIGNAVYQ